MPLQYQDIVNNQQGLNPEQLAAQAQLSTIPAPKPPVVMTPDQIKPVASLNLPQPDFTLANTESKALVDNSKITMDSLDKYLAPVPVEQTQADNLTKTLNQLYEQNTGKAQATQEALINAGVDEKTKQLQEVSNQIKIKNADYNAAFNSLENTPGQIAAVVGSKQQQLQRNQAAEIGMLTARAQALQGDIQLATQTAQRAVDLKFAANEELITAKEKQLALIKDTLSAKEKKIAEALTKKYEADKQELADKKATQKDAVNFALANDIKTPFYTIAGTVYRTIDGKPYSTPQEFFADGGAKDFSNAPVVGKNQKPIQLSEGQSLIDPNTGKVIYKNPKTSVNSGSSGSSNNGNNAVAGNSNLDDLGILAEAVSNKFGSVAAKTSFLKQFGLAKTEDQKIKILASNVVLPAEIKTGIIQNNQVVDSLTKVEDLLNSGVKTGLIKAGQSYLASKTGSVGDKKVEEIKSRLVAALQPYRNKVTGAAWGEQEEAEYQSLIGGIKFEPQALLNKLNTFKDILRQQTKSALLSGIDPLGALNNNSVLNFNQQPNGSNVNDPLGIK